MKHYIVRDMEPLIPIEGVEIRAVPAENMTMAVYNVEPGTLIPEHSHPHEQLGLVLKGSLELVVDRERRVIGPGEAYHVPSNAVHSGRVLDSKAELIEVFSPPRDDLVKTSSGG